MENSGGGGATSFPAGWNVASKPCDSCKSAAALLYCRTDQAFLCMVCDVKLHNQTRHERVWMCELCEQAPAFVTCKADAAALCVTCDRDIHSVNPLAKRHDRIPVVPFYDSAEAVVKTPISNSFVLTEDHTKFEIPTITTNIEVKFPSDALPADMKMADLLSADRLFDFGFAVPREVRNESQFHDSVTDCVVPVQRTFFQPPQSVDHQSPGARYEINSTESPTNSYIKSSTKLHSGHNVCSPSMDAGVVPEQNPMLNISYPFVVPVSGVVSEQNNDGANGTHKATGMDRMARVMRYREKRKNRKFEKKIRYASRKAYAEKRPRIKGRFAKRTEQTTELNADRWLFTAASNCNNHNYGVDVEYGVVPSF